MTPAELERLLAERLVRAATLPYERTVVWEREREATAVVRALEAALNKHWEVSARPTQSRASSAAEALAAFWAAYSKEEGR